jgi:hypothetical protein
VISTTTKHFWARFDRLPGNITTLARKQFRLWKKDPFHPSLHFKEVVTDLWSVRVNVEYRALARRKGAMVVWFWIGHHGEYEKLIANE